MCEFHDSNGNGFADIWRTDKLIYFSIIQELLLKGALRVQCNAGVSVFSEKSVTMKVYGSTFKVRPT